MRALICNVCGGETFVDEDSLQYHAYFCKGCDTLTDHKLKGTEPTVFDRITSSYEALAEKFIFKEWHPIARRYVWYSLLLNNEERLIYAPAFDTKEEAIAATVEKLKEVEKRQ